MTASMPNPFLPEIPHAGSPAPSVSLSAREAGGVSRFRLDERAFMAAVCDPFPASPSLASDSAAAGSAIAPISDGSAVATIILDSEKNIATLLALAAIDTASAEHSTSVKA